MRITKIPLKDNIPPFFGTIQSVLGDSKEQNIPIGI